MQFKTEAEKLKFAQDWAMWYWRKASAIHGAKIGAMPAIEISKRMTKCGGIAYINFADDIASGRYTPHKYEVIRYSSILLANNAKNYADNVIPHELAHFIAYRAYGEKNHGSMFYHVGGELGVVLEFAGVVFGPGEWLYADENGIIVSATPLA